MSWKDGETVAHLIVEVIFWEVQCQGEEGEELLSERDRSMAGTIGLRNLVCDGANRRTSSPRQPRENRGRLCRLARRLLRP